MMILQCCRIPPFNNLQVTNGILLVFLYDAKNPHWLWWASAMRGFQVFHFKIDYSVLSSQLDWILFKIFCAYFPEEIVNVQHLLEQLHLSGSYQLSRGISDESISLAQHETWRRKILFVLTPWGIFCCKAYWSISIGNCRTDLLFWWAPCLFHKRRTSSALLEVFFFFFLRDFIFKKTLFEKLQEDCSLSSSQ